MRKGCLVTAAVWLIAAAGAVAQEPPGPTAAPLSESGNCWPTEPEACGPRLWATAEYLLWWVKDQPLPVPLVTAGSTGVLGARDTAVLLGGRELETADQSGGRFTVGLWLDNDSTWGVEGSYFFLGDRAVQQRVASAGTPGSLALHVPFFDVTLPGESSTRLSDPRPMPPIAPFAPFSGTAVLRVASRLEGAELNGVANLASNDGGHLHALAGFRYLSLNEDLTFATSSPDILPPVDVFLTGDRFQAKNHFYGGQVGARGEWRFGDLSLGLAGKLALGGMSETVHVRGVLLTNDLSGFTGPPTAFPGGYFAQPTNIGDHHRTEFAVVPEVDVTIGYQVTRSLRAFVGYSFLYVSEAARPGNQIDRGINPTQSFAINDAPAALVGTPRPAFRFQGADFWAQGINFGAEFSY